MKKKVMIIILIIIVAVLFFTVIGFILFNKIINEASNNIKLDDKNYLTAVEVKAKSNFIIYINKEQKISNIIFLNDDSVKALFDKEIENKNIDQGVEKIVYNLKQNNDFADIYAFQLVNYNNDDIYNKVYEAFNKNFVIYGVNKTINKGNSTIEEKLKYLDIDSNNNSLEDIRKLYNYSLNVVSTNKYIDDTNEVNINTENIDIYAANVYDKLTKYSQNITNQSKDDLSGIDITTINATGDYKNELYADKTSWYYVENGQVYAYIRFIYGDKIYDYCYKGNKSYTKEIC